jgi:eukaryotic-like serine/threonine-protein kinase
MSKERYEILGTLGCSATSRVEKARDTVLGRTVALKTLVHAFGASIEQKQFLREAQIVSQLSHPAIVSLYDVGIEGENVAYLVMEYIPGKTLQQVLSESAVPFPRACSWAADLAGALSGAHRAGIIHGDIKPGHILVTEDGRVKLGDFGIARFATQVSGSGQMMGTPAYLSPEQIAAEPQSTRSDIFSLGIVLYQMVTGAPPFEGSSVSAVCAQILSAEPLPPSQRNPALPGEIDRIILRCLAKSPADRYPSAGSLAASLYPFARNTWEPAVVTPAPAEGASFAVKPLPPSAYANRNWLNRPLKSSDAWIAAFAALLLLSALPAYHVVAARLRVPGGPLIVAGAPKAPNDLLGYSVSHTWEDVAAAVEEEQPVLPITPVVPTRTRAARVASLLRTKPSRVNLPAKVLTAALPAPPEITAPTVSPISHAPQQRAPLHIEISSLIGEGALAIFADQNLVFTMELVVKPGAPVKLERGLPAGPHQLRVALYRPDKSLQTVKEGLGDLRTDTNNVLRIHVGKKSKMLVRRETALEVSWPSAVAASPGGSAPANLSAASMK